jgi:hypothetical protein
LKRGKRLFPFRQFFRAFSRSRKASCGAHLETSVHQGAFSRFHRFHSRWSSAAEGSLFPSSKAFRERSRPQL